MFEILVSDVLRFSHLLAIAVGIGVAVETEAYMLRRRRTKISPGMMTALDHRHRVILAALAAMWVTGLALVALRTGFQLSAFTPKLWAKVLVVTILTINAVFVSQVALPVLGRHAGRTIASLPLRARRALFSVAGISATSWLLALALGASALLKVSPAPVFQTGLPVAYIAGIFAANWVGLRLFARPARPDARPVAKPEPRRTAVPDAPQPAPKPAPAMAPAPAVTMRASDLAIAFPQKLKRPPRMKPAPRSARAELGQIAADLARRG